MMTEVDELRAQLDQLAEQLAAAEGRIEEMQRQKAPRRPNKKLVVGAVVGLLALLSLGLYAQVGPSPLITSTEGLLLNLTRRVTALEGEVAALKESRPAETIGQRVTAPFEVVDREGNAIMRVAVFDAARGIGLFSSDDQLRAFLGEPTGGESGALIVRNDRAEEAVIGAGSRGNMLLRFTDGENQNIAGLGIGALTGAGTLILGDVNGSTRLSALVEDNGHGKVNLFGPSGDFARVALKIDSDERGTVAVYNAGGKAIATLGESDKVPGVGRVTAHDAEGNGVFTAGWTPSGSGTACVVKQNGLRCIGSTVPVPLGAAAQ